MTNKLKCPYCGRKLWYDEQDGIYRCTNFSCDIDFEGGTEQLWQALIDGKKAQDALVEIKNILESARYADTLNFSLDNADCRQIYEIITSITKDTDNDLGTVD